MEYKNTIITPLPDEQLLNEEEKIWRVSLPASAKEFFKQYSGLIPKKNIFSGKVTSRSGAYNRTFFMYFT